MICKKCGKEIQDNAKFCASCGAPIEVNPEVPENVAEEITQVEAVQNKTADVPPVHTPNEAPAGAATSSFAKLKKMLIGCGVLAAALIALFVFLGAKKPVVDLGDLASVEFSGYDGYGNAYVNYMTQQEAETKYGKKIKFNKKLAAADKAMLGNSPIEAFLDMVLPSFSLNKRSGLKNGDVVTLNTGIDDATIEKYFNLKVKHEAKEYKVEGLKEVGTFDAFADVKVSFDGYDGYGTVKVEGGASGKDLEFLPDKTEGLSNGDTVTLSIAGADDLNAFTERCAEQYGEVPTEITKTYTVSGLKEVGSFDAFAGLELKYDGVSGYAKAVMRASDPEHPELFFFASPLDGLANGDEITVYIVDEEIAEAYENVGANYDDFASFLREEGYGSYETGLMQTCAEKYGSLPETLNKAYTVEGLDYYISKAEDIPEDIREQIKQQTTDATKSIIATGKSNFIGNFWTGFPPDDLVWEIGEYEYLGFYFLKIRNPGGAGEEDNPPSDNAVIAICKTSVMFDYTKNKEAHHGEGELYCYAFFENLYFDKDGKIHVDLGDYAIPSSTRSVPQVPEDMTSSPAEFAGYASMDDLYDSIIAYNLKNYTYEDLTQESAEATTDAKTEEKPEEKAEEKPEGESEKTSDEG